MAASKAIMDTGMGIEHSSLVTCLARNGSTFGMRLGATGDDWYAAPAPTAEGFFFKNYTQADAGGDMGDSAITEANGWGSFILSGSLGFLSGLPADVKRAHQITRDNAKIMVGRNPNFPIPSFDFAGAPVGIDVRRVVKTGILPWINTGITHKDAGHRVIGRGQVQPPMEIFEGALEAMAAKYGTTPQA